jgi:hypothetical protein
MRIKSALCGVMALAALCVGAAVAQLNPTDTNNGSGVRFNPQSVEFLSDTQGVNFQPYMRLILSQMNAKGTLLVPADARLNPAETLIRFTIYSDGTIAAMHLDGSAHDVDLDRAAWGSIVGVGKFPPLPKEFHGRGLELRVHFRVNG